MEKLGLKQFRLATIRLFRNGITLLSVAALSSVVTYVVCNQANEQKLEDLNAQIKLLKAEEKEARVTKRISEQMEDIAFQQKLISDRQRERAEHETQIADIERGKAELERSLALKAERKAIASAAHADSMSLIAQEQTKLAMENLRVAEAARAQSDTLFYKSLSNSLAQSSIAQSQSDTDLSRLLAYASWHYASTYSNTVEDGNVYKALLNAPASSGSIEGTAKGDIRGLKVVTVGNARYTIGISDYGELIFIDSIGMAQYLHPSMQFYRDMTLAPAHCYATITSNGKVSLIDYEEEIRNHSITERQTMLPEGVWHHIVTSPDGTTLVALANNMVAWLSSTDLHIIATAKTIQKNTVLGYAGNTLHIFGRENTHLTSDSPGELVRGVYMADDNNFAPLNQAETESRTATAYIFDSQNNYHILGLDNGDIEYHNLDGSLVRTLSGHNGRISCLDKDGDMLISSSYNHEVRFWFVKDISSLVVAAVQTFNDWPQTFTLDQKLKTMWIGIKGGQIQHFSYSIQGNAMATHSLLRREFTPEEWNYYIGPAIPYRTFIDDNKK